tara:strand:- start:3208 stop:4092 length:885 start_codon:yes stop_codon:yes gene_type:complete
MNSEDIADLRIRENLVAEERAQNVEVSFSVEPIDDRTYRLHVEVSGTIEDYEFNDSHESLLQTSNAVCTPCTRKAGSYFEATVQLRSAGRRLDDVELKQLRGTLDQMLEGMEPDPMFFITKEGSVTGGWDLQLGSKAMARNWGRRLVRAHGGTIKETSTVVGSNDGIDVTRLTLSYRKPAYDLDDVVRFRKQLWMIDGWQSDGPSLRRLDRYERSGATWRDMEKSIVVCPSRDQHFVEVMNRDSSAVEVMDPTDYRMVTVALPYDDDGNTSRIRIGFIDGAWVALPTGRRHVNE